LPPMEVALISMHVECCSRNVSLVRIVSALALSPCHRNRRPGTTTVLERTHVDARASYTSTLGRCGPWSCPHSSDRSATSPDPHSRKPHRNRGVRYGTTSDICSTITDPSGNRFVTHHDNLGPFNRPVAIPFRTGFRLKIRRVYGDPSH